jgi:membrane-bound lytic murein transglycosylase A
MGAMPELQAMGLRISVGLRSVGRIAAAAIWLISAVALDQAHSQTTVDPLQIPDTQLEPIQWSELAGWASDDHGAAFAAFQASCEAFNRQRQLSDTRAVAAALKDICKRMPRSGTLTGDKARAFFEENFRPVRIAKLGESTGLLTGYYEPIVDGSRMPNPQFHVPLYRRPSDIVIQSQSATASPAQAVNQNQKRAGLSLKGPAPKAAAQKGTAQKGAAQSGAAQKKPSWVFPNRGTVGRLNDKKEFEPYHDRLAIEEGALDGKKLEICYIADPFEAMSIQIQGSARVRLEDGTILRLNYNGHNGHNYTAVGRILIERNLIPREEMTMDRIKRWMLANPDQAREVRGTNKSFVFFRITGLNNEEEPVGAQGVHLSPGRSIAVDKTHVYGTPFFIESDLPIENPRAATKFRRLMVAQDTGSAIIGPARADLYWGAGDDAGKIAGRIRQQGRFVMLMPRALDMVEAGRKMPLPPVKPPVEVASKGEGKSDKTDGKAASGKSETNKSESSKSGEAKNGKADGKADSKAGRQAGRPKSGS